MSTVSTETFPYTVRYVSELLRVEESELLGYAQHVGLAVKQDEMTGSPIFSQQDVETLRKVVELTRQGQDIAEVASRLRDPNANNANSISASVPAVPSLQSSKSASLAGKDNLATMVETVSQAKEGILRDMSRLLDDKLAGLDEVVVELIRCKSENDALRQKIEQLTAENENLVGEVGRFKQVQFGFYRKV